MKKDGQEGNQQPPGSQTENPGATDNLPANSNGNETNRTLDAIDAEASGKRAVSSRKREANRQNARNSTGPRTAAGKKRVSRNAIRHGFYSKCLLVQDQDGKESEAEYEEWYAKIFKQFQPVGWLQEYWVDKIAAWSWRLRRLIRYETGQIAMALAQHRFDLQQAKAAASEEPESAPLSSPEMDSMTDHLFLTSEGLENRMRCEAMINRELNHAIAELEKLQKGGKGESNS